MLRASVSVRGLSLAVLVLVACSRHGSEPEAGRVTGWRTDLRTLATELPLRHKDAFHTIDKAAWGRSLAAIERELPSLDDAHITVRLTQLVASIGDAHTRLRAGDRGRVYPLRFAWFDDGIFVVGATPEHAAEVGSKLVGIGSYTIDEVIARFSPLVSRDNDAGLRSELPAELVRPVTLAGLDLAAADHATFELMAADGRVHDLDVRPGDMAPKVAAPTQLPLRLTGPGTAYWNKYVDADRLLYFAYNACVEDSRVGSFAAFVESTMAFADQHPVDRFVIDLRNNGGGNSAIIEPLLEGLAKRPKLADRVFVIIGMNTFSSAVLNAMQLKRRLHATLVGGRTAGSPSHFGEVKTFELPSSHLVVQYSTKYFAYPDFPGDAVEPDLAVAMTSTDWFSGRDRALDAIGAAP